MVAFHSSTTFSANTRQQLTHKQVDVASEFGIGMKVVVDSSIIMCDKECRGNRCCARRHHNKCIMLLLFIIIATTILPTAHAQTGTEACSTAACTSSGGKCVTASPNVSDSQCADCADGKQSWWPCVSSTHLYGLIFHFVLSCFR